MAGTGDAMGPISYLVAEFPGSKMTGRVATGGLERSPAPDPDEPDGRGGQHDRCDPDDDPEQQVAHAGASTRSTFWLTTCEEPPGAMVTP